MVSGGYNRQKFNYMTGATDFDNDTVKVMLLDSSHSFTATDNVIGDVDSNEITGTGYTAGGATLANGAVTQGATTKFDADDVVWTTGTFTTNHAVIYDVTATSNLVISLDFGGAQTVTGADFTIQWHTDGIFDIS